MVYLPSYLSTDAKERLLSEEEQRLSKRERRIKRAEGVVKEREEVVAQHEASLLKRHKRIKHAIAELQRREEAVQKRERELDAAGQPQQRSRPLPSGKKAGPQVVIFKTEDGEEPVLDGVNAGKRSSSRAAAKRSSSVAQQGNGRSKSVEPGEKRRRTITGYHLFLSEMKDTIMEKAKTRGEGEAGRTAFSRQASEMWRLEDKSDWEKMAQERIRSAQEEENEEAAPNTTTLHIGLGN